MEIDLVNDISFDVIKKKRYDIAFFSCGYESRSIGLPKKLLLNNIEKIIILYFRGKKDACSRKQNEKYYKTFKNEKIDLDYDEEGPIYEILNKCTNTIQKKDFKILIDYSSMSRIWYVSILNWARVFELDSLSIDFIYSVGKYDKPLSPLLIEETHTLPGHEGVTSHHMNVSIFGLGFDPKSTLCVFDKLEPTKIHTFIANPMFEGYKNKVEDLNKDFIESYSESVQYYPLSSVEKTFRLMSELITPYRDEYNISFIPMGPKPHVLASALISTKFSEVINLYIKGERLTPLNVYSSGKFICTEVLFK